MRMESDMWRLTSVIDDMIVHRVDLRDADHVRTVVQQINPEAVVHLANVGVYTGISGADRDVIETNFLATVSLIDACRNQPRCSRFVNVGSSSEYGRKRQPLREGDACEPESSYAVAKCAATQYAAMVGRNHSWPIVTLRLFSPFGPFDDYRRLIPYVVAHASAGRPLRLASPFNARDFVYIDDVTDAIVAALTVDGVGPGEVVNIGSGSQSTVKDVVDHLLAIVGAGSVDVAWNNVTPRPWDTDYWQADVTRARDVLQWVPRVSMREGLAAFVDWYLRHADLYARWFGAVVEA